MPSTQGQVAHRRLVETGPVEIVRAEEIVAELWAEVLGLPTVDPAADFFLIGGNSLDAAVLLTRVQNRFGLRIGTEQFFRSPTVTGLCDLLNEAKPEAGFGAPSAARSPDRTHEFPATAAQRRLWFLDRFIAQPEVYNVHRLQRVTGDLDLNALGAALGELTRRHETLRTRFGARAGEPIQVVESNVSVDLHFSDFCSLNAKERLARVRHEAEADIRRPFLLGEAPLWRVRVWKTDAEDFFLLLNFHHTITDGVSLTQLLDELSDRYEASRQGDDSPLPSPALQYGDYAVRERAWLQSDEYREKLAWWKRTLTPVPATLDLPFAKPRPRTQSFRGGLVRFDIPAETVAAIDRVAKANRSTRFKVGLAAFSGLVHRYTGGTDIGIGTITANRRKPEAVRVQGFLANTIVVRTAFEPKLTFRDSVLRVRDTSLAAIERGDVPFEAVVEEVKPERDTGRQPLFQLLFLYQNQGIATKSLGRHEWDTVPIHNDTAMFDLRMVLEDKPDGGLAGRIEYSRDLFDRFHMERMTGHFLRFLAGGLANPDAEIDSLPLLGEAERDTIVEGWNATAGAAPEECLHAAFERQAKLRPDDVAVVGAGESWTFGELNRRANGIAKRLRAAGAGPGSFVGICLRRTPMIVAAALGVAKSGAAYVPLDPAYPAERLAFMRKDTAAEWVLTEKSLRDALPADGFEAILLDATTAGDDANPEPRGTPDDLAYVIYTSGSTGQPKGVMVRHRPAVNTLDWVNKSFQVGPRDRLLFVTSLSFDLSVYDIFGALGAGASLRIASEEESRDPAKLLEIVRNEATIWDSAPAALQQLVPFLPKGQPSRKLRLVMLSGDWIPVAMPDRVRAAFPNAKVVSLGGATEAAIWSNWFPIDKVDPAWASIPYGKPIRNARYHVLDARLQPQPVGVPGELHIGGDVLADGYWNRPELTAERFIADPYRPGGKLYKTGDLARYGSDGNIEFLGRIDNQVKVRGFRVEVGEIEAVLGGHPRVLACAVKPFRDSSGQNYLAAFVVAKDGSPLEPEALIRFLKLKLPDYMVPARFVELPELPVTANGKLDRAALVEPTAARPVERYEPPCDVLEELVAGVWAEALGIGAVDRNANFFELGGHSLRAAQVVAQLQDRCGVELRLPTLFDRPTVAGLAEALRELQGKARSLPLLGKAAQDDRERLSPVQRRFWYLDRSLANKAIYNVADVYALDGPLDVPAFERAWQAALGRHESLRSRFPGGDEEPRLVVDPVVSSPMPFLDHSHGTAEETKRVLEADAAEPFDIAAGPIHRARLIKLAEGRHLFALTVHHIAMDEGSRAVLLRDIAEAYRSGVALPAPAIAYADYSAWLWKWLEGDTVRDQLNYWRGRLKDCPPALALPHDRLPALEPKHEGATLYLEAPASWSGRLAECSRGAGATPFMAGLAAFQVLLSRLCAQDDVCVGTPIMLRHSAAARELVGCFVNTLPMRLKVDPERSFADALSQTRTAALGAFGNADVPFEMIVEDLSPERMPGRNPFFQTIFVHVNESVAGAFDDRLSWRHDRSIPVGAKFDLRLSLVNLPGKFGVELEYDTGLFEQATARRIGECYLGLLDAALSNPTMPVGDLDYMPAPEMRLATEAYQGPVRGFPADKTIHQMVEEQVRRTPTATAFEAEGKSIAYAEWNARANRLAVRLRDAGVKADTLVGVCLDRTLDLPVAMLAIAKAGGAYVPLDPFYPAERLALYVRDCGMPVIVATENLRSKLPASGAELVLLDKEAEAIAALPSDDLEPFASPSNLFYVIYTSGSTGVPNGAAIEHRSAVNLLDYLAGQPEFTAKDVVLAVSTTSFDIHVLDYWLPALLGMKVVLAPRAAALDGEKLVKLLAETDSTLMSVTPATWRLILSAGWTPTPRLKAICGGEAMTAELATGLLQRCGAVWNIYGPTETTVFSVWHRLKSGGMPPIGLPVANTTIHLLDARRKPVPFGCVGEMYIAGAGLGRGYVRRKDQTAERFLETPHGRLYRTGDLGRRRADGTIECLGRADFQVKVRGFRIEPGEVERVLEEHPDVKQAVVVARPDPSGGAALHAYCTPGRGLAMRPAPAVLRDYLAGQLPDYMVPSTFTVLDAFPMTPSGKVDRRALPAPELTATVAGDDYTAPRDDRERAIQAIWEEVFDAKPIGVHANFFDLGGHSLQAAFLMSRMEKRLNCRLPLEALFATPTIRGLANRLGRTTEGAMTETIAAEPATNLMTGAEDLELPDGYEGPINDEERALQAIWEEVLEIKPISVTDNFEDLAADSVQAALLMSRVERRLGHRLPLESLFQAKTIRGLACILQKNLELGKGVLVPLQTQGKQPPFFMIAGAGGHVFAFHKFARLLGMDQPTYGMKAIGVDGTEEPVDTVPGIAARYMKEILAERPEGPYVLSGYSVGGTIALELALQLQAAGKKVSRIIVFDTLAPGYPKPLPFHSRVGQHMRNFIKLRGEKRKRYLADRYDHMKKRILYALNLHRYYAPRIPGVAVVPQETIRKVWGALYKAREAYRPAGVYDGKVVVVNSEVPREWVGHKFDDPNKGWDRYAAKGVQLYTVPAEHMEFFRDDNIELLASQVREVLRSAASN